jgi:hypothetical protein
MTVCGFAFDNCVMLQVGAARRRFARRERAASNRRLDESAHEA